MNLFKNKNFLLHWLSSGMSHIGGFFTLLALPWLVLSISNNNPILMSTVMACISLPHGFFILFGGALADRYSPFKVLIIARISMFFVVFSLGLIVYFNITSMVLLYIYALFIGTLSSVATPASQSILPVILPATRLGNGNSILMGTTYLAQILGPLFAGWLIWFIRSIRGIAQGQSDLISISYAFILDACLILVAICLMTSIKIVTTHNERNQNILNMVSQGLRFCWEHRNIRIVLLYLILISFFIHGPLMTVLPVLIKVQLGLSEADYGNLYAMIGIGTVIGAGLAILKTPSDKLLGVAVLICDCIAGLALYFMSYQIDIWSIALLLLIIGSCSGFITISGITWFQKRTPDIFMGRVMSILLFTIFGLVPISSALTGLLIDRLSISHVLAYSGIVIVLCSITGLIHPKIRTMGCCNKQFSAVISTSEIN